MQSELELIYSTVPDVGGELYRMLVPHENPCGWLYFYAASITFVPFPPKLYHDDPAAIMDKPYDSAFEPIPNILKYKPKKIAQKT